MGRIDMLLHMSDASIRILLTRGKKLTGARPFIANPRMMIALRDEAERRGIYGTIWEEDAVQNRVLSAMKPQGGGVHV